MKLTKLFITFFTYQVQYSPNYHKKVLKHIIQVIHSQNNKTHYQNNEVSTLSYSENVMNPGHII